MAWGTVIYAVAFSTITIARYNALHTFAWDLGVYSQSMYTTAREGQFFLSTPDLPNNPNGTLFGVHFAPVLILLLPIFWILPVPGTLLVLQSVGLASGAPVVFRLARSRLSSDRIAGALAFVYLLNPALQGVNWYDFHPEAFLVPFALLAIYAWERRSWKWFWVAILASLSTLEFSGVVMLALGLYWLVDSFQMRELRSWIRRKETWHAAFVCVAGTAWALVGIRLIFHFNPGLADQTHATWQPLGATSIYQLPLAIVLNPAGVLAGLAWEWPFKALYMVSLFGPLLFLPFRRPLTLLMSAPWLLAALTSTRRTFYVIGDQYPSFVIPFVFYGAILGWERFRVRGRAGLSGAFSVLRTERFFMNAGSRHFVVFGVVTVVFFTIMSPLGPIRGDNFNTGGLPAFGAHVEAVWAAVDLVPPGATILTQNNLFPYFTDRIGSYVVPVGAYFRPGATFNGTIDGYLAGVDYVLVDAQTSLGEAASVLSRPVVRTDFGVVAWQDGVVLLRRGFPGPPEIYRPVSLTFNARSLDLLEGFVVDDPASISETVLFHPAGGGNDFWRGPHVYLWPGDYAVSFRLKVDPPIAGAVLTVGVSIQPAFLLAQGEIPGEGHFAYVTAEIARCNVTFTTMDLQGTDFGGATRYVDFSLRFRADAFGLYDFRSYSVTSQTGAYLDRIALMQEAALGYHRILSCP